MITCENRGALSRRLSARMCIALVLCALMLGAAGAADYDSPEYWREDWERMGALGKGFVVWESNRTDGFYRIWYRNLDGSGLRQITPE
ncbi:MAG: hypothetical protein HQ592_08510 [Planctomycetes bacterium]|nr:hypothetical protein [Planctomycetota bacterium]